MNAAGTDGDGPATNDDVVGGPIGLLAGALGGQGFLVGMGAAARFNSPYGVAIDASGNAYVADTSNHVIRKITPAGVVSTVAGKRGEPGSIDGATAEARFNYPAGLAFDAVGNLCVADKCNYTIRRITPAGAVSTVAGKPGAPGTNNGTANINRAIGIGGRRCSRSQH